MAFWLLIEPAVTTTSTKAASVTAAHGRTMTHLPPVDEFLFLNYLTLGLKQKDLGHRFGVHLATVSRIIVSWANFLHCLLGAIGMWMPADRVKANLPVEFRGKHEDTQVILDCAEVLSQMPSSLLLQSEVFSSYKSHCMLKVWSESRRTAQSHSCPPCTLAQ